jgi:hypothetical protein
LLLRSGTLDCRCPAHAFAARGDSEGSSLPLNQAT